MVQEASGAQRGRHGAGNGLARCGEVANMGGRPQEKWVVSFRCGFFGINSQWRTDRKGTNRPLSGHGRGQKPLLAILAGDSYLAYLGVVVRPIEAFITMLVEPRVNR